MTIVTDKARALAREFIATQELVKDDVAENIRRERYGHRVMERLLMECRKSGGIVVDVLAVVQGEIDAEYEQDRGKYRD